MASLFRRDPEILLAATAQTVSASTTLVAVTSLTTRVLTAGTYCFELILDMTQSTTGGYKMDFGGGTAAFSAFLMNAHAANVGAGTLALIEAERDTSATEAGLNVSTSVTPAFYRINGAFTVSTAGTFAPRFAQNNAAGTCSVTALSTLSVRKTG